ncbi:hypothetical protein D1007_31585 [Hordeum vulgare]|nr:hypothetical protein D1007_31585 [Hordeum vulgare]
MHVGPEVLVAVVWSFQCCVGSFPQSYLGLPLSCDKLKLDDFAPLIAKVDRYLAGWTGQCSSTLSSTPSPPMPWLPCGSLMRCSLCSTSSGGRSCGNVTDRASGAQCVVAWERVYRSKVEGRLGVRALEVQNVCLLLKLLHRLHLRVSSRWASWAWGQLGGRSLLAHDCPRGGGALACP